MCLIAIAWRQSARYPLIIAANRDEAHDRPTLPAQQWHDTPGVYGGRDLREGGSWLALSATGRLAAVTNVRVVPRIDGMRSRGHLVRDYVVSGDAARLAGKEIAANSADYGPFNLVLCDGRELVHVSNRPSVDSEVLPPGIHGVSNGALESQWPKVTRLKAALADFVQQLDTDATRPDLEALFQMLRNPAEADDSLLPDTGVGLAAERRLSSVFVTGDEYGTRASTVVLVAADGAAQLIERSFGPAGLFLEDRQLETRSRR